MTSVTHVPVQHDIPRDCTFDPDDWAILAGYWYPIALEREITAEPVSVRLLDQPLVVYRAGAEIVVANDLCPHRGMPLSKGRGDGTGVSCAYHGLKFGVGGRCVQIPASPRSKIPDRMRLRSHPVTRRYGLVWTCLRPESDTDSGPIPAMPHWDDPAFQQINCPSIDIAAFAGRQVEGFLDVAHFGFVHAGSFGDPNNTEVPRYRPVPTRFGFEVDYRSTVGNYPHGGKVGEPGFVWLRHFDVHLPFTATLVVHFPGDGRLSIMNAASPVSARMTRMFAPIARDFDTGQPVAEVYDFNRQIFEEDRVIVEAQKPENLPLDPRIEVSIAADRSSVAYRRGLRDLGLSHFFTA